MLGGASSHRLTTVAKRVTRQGFETSVNVKGGPVFKVQALDAKGKVLGGSRAVRRSNTRGNAPVPSY